MVILQFNFFVVTVKYLCNGRRRITTTYFLVLVLPRLHLVFAMQLQCFVFISNVFCNQNSHSIQTNSHKIQTEIYNGVISNLENAWVSSPATLQMQGFRIFVKTCECKSFHDRLNLFLQRQ